MQHPHLLLGGWVTAWDTLMWVKAGWNRWLRRPPLTLLQERTDHLQRQEPRKAPDSCTKTQTRLSVWPDLQHVLHSEEKWLHLDVIHAQKKVPLPPGNSWGKMKKVRNTEVKRGNTLKTFQWMKQILEKQDGSDVRRGRTQKDRRRILIQIKNKSNFQSE